MAEGILERVIQDRGANVEKGLHGRPVPAHLLFLIHALGHDLIDRTLDERRGDRLTPWDRPEMWGIMTIGIGPAGYVAGWGFADGMDAAFGRDGD